MFSVFPALTGLLLGLLVHTWARVRSLYTRLSSPGPAPAPAQEAAARPHTRLLRRQDNQTAKEKQGLLS